jgi:hypothetical protein
MKNAKQKEYYNYVEEHKSNIIKVFEKVISNFAFPRENVEDMYKAISSHDMSKYTPEEFMGYCQWFYPETGVEKNKAEYDKAWKHHYENNPHHWEYWKGKEMQTGYVIEMLCDWSAMSLKFNDLPSEFYNKKKDKIVFGDKTREKVESWLPTFDKIVKQLQEK